MDGGTATAAAPSAAPAHAAGCPWAGSTAPVEQRVSQVMAQITQSEEIALVHGVSGTSRGHEHRQRRGVGCGAVAIQIYTCNGTNAQRWTVTSDHRLTVLGKCMDVTSAGTTNGTKVQLYDCNGTAAQTWRLP